jgi:hypothetical protein
VAEHQLSENSNELSSQLLAEIGGFSLERLFGRILEMREVIAGKSMAQCIGRPAR